MYAVKFVIHILITACGGLAYTELYKHLNHILTLMNDNDRILSQICNIYCQIFVKKHSYTVLVVVVSWFNWWVSFALEFQWCYFCESSCLFCLSFNFDFYVS